MKVAMIKATRNQSRETWRWHFSNQTATESSLPDRRARFFVLPSALNSLIGSFVWGDL